MTERRGSHRSLHFPFLSDFSVVFFLFEDEILEIFFISFLTFLPYSLACLPLNYRTAFLILKTPKLDTE